MLEKSYNYTWPNKREVIYFSFYCCDLTRINNTIGIKPIPKNHGKFATTNATILLITSAMPHPVVRLYFHLKIDSISINYTSLHIEIRYFFLLYISVLLNYRRNIIMKNYSIISPYDSS